MTVRGALLPPCALLLLLSGCSGSGESARTVTSAPGGFPARMAQAESTFNPTDYGIETWEKEPGPPKDETAEATDSSAVQVPDTIPGFRVQVTITGDIDYAGHLRDSLAHSLGGEPVYVVYHPPYYKVRVGNFTERFAAAGMLDMLRRRGFPDAWIVPDRVLRNPPPPVEEVPLLPDSALEGGSPPH